MNNFDYYAPTEVVFGKQTKNEVGNYIDKYGGKNVLIVFGSDRVIKNGLIDEVKESLNQENIKYTLLGGVVPNPQLSKVYEGIELGHQHNIDFILAIGGGSAIDTAKAIAYGIAEPDKDVWTLYEHTRQAVSCLPVASILTIAAAGSETSMGSVITNEVTHEKRAYDDNLARPKFTIMNPELTLTLPKYQTNSGITDIMMHTMERYFTNGSHMELTDAIAEGLLKTVMKNAKILQADPTNYEARAEIMWAGSLSHNDLTRLGTDGGDFATHMLEHEVSGMYGVTHGAGLAAIWPSWARYVYQNNLSRFVKFAINVMKVDSTGTESEIALKGIEAMEDFYHSIEMPINLKELKVSPTDDEIEIMANRFVASTGGFKGSIKKIFGNDAKQIYLMAR
ncbi:iron-containing alcohol dehydrogenase [Lentilactobacillus laojiaonis]|uniref:iron-containing alcohol dehydrogenase n=1 Tax=Lentilactobacillus laojiaonis TaxID=2883998 RepID=UPI001D0A0B04|nr:iron-containing alcohol dehydrogenase [Lentilactobacillus laojiaonis]UDM32402.1 iron-containing alcohol dehydrogenase [Lentilactobacillus laojiaonis]